MFGGSYEPLNVSGGLHMILLGMRPSENTPLETVSEYQRALGFLAEKREQEEAAEDARKQMEALFSGG